MLELNKIKIKKNEMTKKYHSKLCSKYKWYKDLHNYPQANLLMWSLFIFVSVFTANAFVVSSNYQVSSVGDVITDLNKNNASDLFASTTKKDLATETVRAINRQQQDKTIKRYKISEGKIDIINNRSSQNSPTITIDLFDGQVITVDKARIIERGANNFTWRGKVRGAPDGQVILSVTNGYLSGLISFSEQNSKKKSSYSIEPVGENLYSVRENDFSNIADEPSSINANSSDIKGDISSNTVNQTSSTALGDTGSSIDVLVLYSNQSAAATGAYMQSQAQSAIDVTNQAYANSGLPIRLNLVHVDQISYNETGDFVGMLNDITYGTNGAQVVSQLRNTYKADLVTMFVESTAYCGMGWVNSNVSLGYTVVKRTCASSNFSLAHEIGHNMGLLHDPATDSSSYPYAYGHGYVDPGCQFRTIMAYPNCGSPRVAYFSNPNMTYPGTNSVLGNTSVSNSVRVLSDRADTIANFINSSGTATCAHKNPSLTITPSNQNGSAGQSLTYQVKLINNDDISCPASLFTISPNLPTALSQTPSSFNVSLSPGAQNTQSFVITSNVSTLASVNSFTETAINTGASSYSSSASASYTIPAVDNTPPVVSITNPTQGTVLPKKGSSKINIQVSASDTNSISNINISVDGVILKSCTLVTSCSYSWTYTKASTGIHTIGATAIDNSLSKNQSTTSITVTK